MDRCERSERKDDIGILSLVPAAEYVATRGKGAPIFVAMDVQLNSVCSAMSIASALSDTSDE